MDLETPAPLLSIVSVVKDDPEGLHLTLNSVLPYLDDRTQVTVIDGSGDAEETMRVVSEYGSHRVDLRWSTPAGVYPAMNLGLSWARGEYVLFLNAGDALHDPAALITVLATLERDAPRWLVARVAFADSSGRVVVPAQFDYAVEQRHHFTRGVFPPHQGTVVRRQDLLALGGFDESYRITADYKAALQLSTIAEPILSDVVLATFHEGGVSGTHWQDSMKEFRRARQEVYGLQGWPRVRDDVVSAVQYSKIFAARALRRVRT